MVWTMLRLTLSSTWTLRAESFLRTGEFGAPEFLVVQKLNYEELEGQNLSFAVMPLPGDAASPPMQRALRDYFARYQSGGTVLVPMACTIYVGRLERST